MVEQTDPRAPGWKRDPWKRFAGRYWDGSEWTEHVVSNDRVRAMDPVPPMPPLPTPPPPTQPNVPPPPTTLTAPASGPADTQNDGAAAAFRPQSLQAPPPKVRRRLPLWAKILIPVALIIVIAAALAPDDDKDKPSSASARTTAATDAVPTSAVGTASAAKSSYGIGDTAKTSDFEVTVYGVKDPQPAPSQFDHAATGSHYVSVDVQVANKSQRQQTFSSIIGYHLVDGANRQYDVEITSLKPGPPDGQIPAGEAIRGFVVFEVPDGTTGLRFRVQGSITASGAFFTLT